MEPEYVFLTAYSTRAFRKHVTDLNIEKIYEKPLQLETLQEIVAMCDIPVVLKKKSNIRFSK